MHPNKWNLGSVVHKISNSWGLYKEKQILEEIIFDLFNKGAEIHQMVQKQNAL